MSDRILRINESMRQVLSEAVADLSDPRIGFVTITSVRIARDFRNAKVFVSILGDERDQEKSFAALRSAHGLLQRAVASKITMHHTPKLEFVRDDTIDAAMKIEAIIQREEAQRGSSQ